MKTGFIFHNEIIISPDGCAAVVGPLAHAAWFGDQRKALPVVKCCANNFYVITPDERGMLWITAAQSSRYGAERYMHPASILVDVTNAPRTDKAAAEPKHSVAVRYEYEDELPRNLSREEYDAMFPLSVVDGVRLFPYVEIYGQRYYLAQSHPAKP